MEWLKRKELGLPIWAWVVIAAVILFVGWKWLSGRGGGPSSGSGPLTGASSPQDSSGDSSGDQSLGDGFDSTQPPGDASPPDVQPFPENDTSETNEDFGPLPSDQKQRTAVKAKRNTAGLRKVLKKALTKQPKGNKKAKVKVKAKPQKTVTKPVAKKAAPVKVQKKTTPAAVSAPVKRPPPTPPKKKAVKR